MRSCGRAGSGRGRPGTPGTRSAPPGDRVYVGCADRNVYALDAADGHTVWTYPADVTVRTSAPVAIGGSVFIGTAGGYVRALTPPGGG
ncbi:outer membrane protein assembly factor BamB family protein [Actinomadura madurae]|uniref:outer membrane protein assembly factor BamB family protein n=1 Tax=Actinomadura madurae TaxID=1993 RepID=UPI003557AF46